MHKWNTIVPKIVLMLILLWGHPPVLTYAGSERDELCMACHQTEGPVVDRGLLGRSSHRDLACLDCHEGADTIENHYESEIDLGPVRCGSCHRKASAEYAESIHQSGRGAAPSCSGCHGSHDIRAAEDPVSRVHRTRVPDTCGGCHAGVLSRYRESIHGRQFEAGLYTAPVCTDCHAAHDIRPVGMEAWKLEIVRECGTCHSESLRTFRDTFHGKIVSLGFTRVARCADCHTAHEIQPARDSRSTVHPANRLNTCRTCHTTATAGFVRYDPHADPDDRNRNAVLYYAGWFMVLLLLGVFAFFGLHALLWAIRSMAARWAGETPRARPRESGPYYVRFTASQRTLHGLLIVSFLGIVITGLPLLYSDSGWAARLARALGGFGAMGFFHRVFAIILTILFVYHLAQILYWVAVRKDWGVLWGPNSLMPQPRDIVEIVRNFMWFFGLGPRPKFGRFTYWEKFDYLAVFWGMPVIGLTGYILWFDEFMGRFIPGWWFNVALLIHGEEALLAAAFIFTIHYFNTHLRPEKFPMDLVIFTGRVSEAELREERPEEFNRLVEEGRLASIQTEPPPIGLKWLGWIAGGAAVVIGLILFVLILIAVLGR